MFFPTATSGWEDLPPFIEVATWDETSRPNRSTGHSRTHTRPRRKHHFQPYHRHSRPPAHALLNPPSPSFNLPTHCFSAGVQDALVQTLANGWATSTLAGYLRHMCHFLEFCKQEQVPAALQFPTDKFVLCAYAALDAGRLSASTIQNRLSGLKAWHNAHNATWNGGMCLWVIVNGAKNMAPSSSKMPP